MIKPYFVFEARGAANASFFVADVQTDDLRGPYDFAFARFGTMFFMSPGAALSNIRKSLQPGGRLVQIVWRQREDNPWLFEAEQRVKEIVPVVSHEDTDEVHCGPGPGTQVRFGPTLQSAARTVTIAGCVSIGTDAAICELDEAVLEIPYAPIAYGCELAQYVTVGQPVVFS